MNASAVIAMGLPNAGKSTFLAALAYTLQHGEIPTELQLSRLPDDLEYLNLLVTDWLTCKTLTHTPAGVTQSVVSLSSKDAPLGDLIFPDISGETFEHHWSLREWEPEFAEIATQASGILLFVHPDHLEKPYSIADELQVSALADVSDAPENSTKPDLLDGPQPGPDRSASQPSTATLWSPEKAASQVKLVDLLQMILSKTARALPLRLGIVVSAWDLVLHEGTGISPEEWVGRAAPYLHQFVSMNPEAFVVRFFGVSAQGGDNVKDAARLTSIDQPSTRVIVVGEDCRANDITAPLKWVLGSNA